MTSSQKPSPAPDMKNCWQQIGVFSKGKPSCLELRRVIHCRNCNIFTQAGRRLLEREMPDGYRDEWAEIIATRKADARPGTISVVIFRIGAEWLALRTRLFAEVVDPERFHTLPHRKNPVLMGVINVHGEIRLCISLSDLLDIGTGASDPGDRRIYRRMMVISHEGEQWVFPVDEIHGVYRVHPDSFQEVPVTVAKSHSTFTKALFKWKEKNVAFLDDELLLRSLARSVQ